MIHRRKKITALSLIAVLSVTLLSSCGKNDLPNNTDTDNDKTDYAYTVDTPEKEQSALPDLPKIAVSSNVQVNIAYVTGAPSVAVYSSNNGTAAPITEVRSGKTVELLDKDLSKALVHIKTSDGTQGYMYSDYLTDSSSSVTVGENAVIETGGYSLYSDHEHTKEIRALEVQETINILAKTSGGYWRIRTVYGETGYLNTEALGKIESLTPLDDPSDNPPDSPSYSAAASSIGTVLEDSTSTAQANAGGQWQSALIIPSKDITEYTSDHPKQAASLIKLFIMGAIYENYDTYIMTEPSLDTYLYSMITVSDNDSANHLVGILGSGNTDAGQNVVTAYCRANGYSSTSMGRLLLESSENGDNYTSAYDCAKFLLAVYNGELPHSSEMLSLLRQQERTSKIPAGVPVETANKTGELADVQNDAAIVFADTPYILCVLAEDVNEGSGISNIVAISSQIYSAVSE